MPCNLPSGFPTSYKSDWGFMVAERKKASISWVPRLATDNSYVDARVISWFSSVPCGCSAIGMFPGGPTLMKLRIPSELGSCRMRTTIFHESAHSLGFTHEHQRPDRDKQIKLNPVATGLDKGSFGIISNALPHTPFDFSSISLYAR